MKLATVYFFSRCLGTSNLEGQCNLTRCLHVSNQAETGGVAAAKGVFGFGDIRTVRAAAHSDGTSGDKAAEDSGACSNLEVVLFSPNCSAISSIWSFRR